VFLQNTKEKQKRNIKHHDGVRCKEMYARLGVRSTAKKKVEIISNF